MKNLLILIFLTSFLFNCSQSQSLENDAINMVKGRNYVEAIKVYEKICKLEKENARSLNNLGMALFRNDELFKAKNKLQEALKVCKKEEIRKSININLSIVDDFINIKGFIGVKHFNKAIEIINKIKTKHKFEELNLKYISLYYYGIGKTDIALEKWNDMIYLFNNSKHKNKFYRFAKAKIRETKNIIKMRTGLEKRIFDNRKKIEICQNKIKSARNLVFALEKKIHGEKDVEIKRLLKINMEKQKKIIEEEQNKEDALKRRF